MWQRVKKLGCYLLIILLLPYVVTVFVNGPGLVSSSQVDSAGVRVNTGEGEVEMSLEEYKAISPVFEEDIYEAISMKNCVEKRNTIGAPGTEAMKQVIELHKKYLKENS